VIKPGTVTDTLVSQVDFPASFARLAGADATPFLGLDSLDVSAAFKGGDSPRDHIISHATGQRFSLREGKWVYVAPYTGTVGRAFHGPGAVQGIPTNVDQLYDLSQDPGERVNLADKHPEVLERLKARLAASRAKGEALPLPR
jgi:arylsulfatase A-like enzyme